MPDAHARAVAREIAAAQADPDVVGLLLCGSGARGDALPGSDLDLRLFLRDGAAPRPFSAADENGVFVERTFHTFRRPATGWPRARWKHFPTVKATSFTTPPAR
jgi:hypothetical protein